MQNDFDNIFQHQNHAHNYSRNNGHAALFLLLLGINHTRNNSEREGNYSICSNNLLMCYNLQATNNVYVPRRLQDASAVGYVTRLSGSPMNNSVSMSEL